VTDQVDPAGGVQPSHSRLATGDLARRLAAEGWSVRVVDLSHADDKATMLGAFGQALAFPDWVGRNWDALEDALRDLSWWPPGATGRVIIVRGARRDATGTEVDRATLRSVLDAAADHWARTVDPLVVLLRR
jgi:hypothetical protein